MERNELSTSSAEPVRVSSASLEVGRPGFANEKDIDLFISKLEQYERGEISADEWRAFRLVNGIYGQRQDGVMMVRVKIPGGIVTPPQLLALSQVAEEFGHGKGHVTTRQNLQYHFVDPGAVETILRRLAAVGLTTREACGHSVRNITCCPFAGISASEPFDPTPYAEALVRHLLRGPYSSTLPRKFKISVGGCCDTDCSQAHINDLGFLVRERDGKPGFRVVVGGGLGNLRRSAFLLEEFLPAEEVLEVADAVVRVFNRIGNRKNKAQARLRWAIYRIGVEEFLEQYRAERVRIREEGGVPLTLPAQPAPPTLRAPLPQWVSPASYAPGYAEWARDNVRPQKQSGFSAVVIRLPLGDITAVQLAELSRIAVQHGEGEVRITNEQNILLRYVSTWRLPLLHRDLWSVGLARSGAGTIVDVTSCPGATSCKLAVTSSRGLASLLSEFLESRPDIAAKAPDLAIKISGCPSSCGQHPIGGIGFQGGMRKVGGRASPQYLLFLGGGVGQEGATFGTIVGKVPARKIPEVLSRLLDLYAREKEEGEPPHHFFARLPVERAKSVLGSLLTLTEEEAREEDFVDLGESRAFSVFLQEGECAA